MDVGFNFTYDSRVIEISKPLEDNVGFIYAFDWNTIKDRILFLIDILKDNNHIVSEIQLCMSDGSEVHFSENKQIKELSYPVKYLNFTDIYTFGDNQNEQVDIIYIFLN